MVEQQYEAVIVTDDVIQISKVHLSFIYVFISWSLIYLFIFVTQPSWVVSTSGYLQSFTSGSGTPLNVDNGGINNTLLSDEGRSNILWVSFLFALLVGFIIYLLLYFY